MTMILSLHGRPGAGKDTIADYLVETRGFIKFGYADALYREVQQAFGLDDQAMLRNRAIKEDPQEYLALRHCKDPEFVALATSLIDSIYSEEKLLYPTGLALSPRRVLQWWGTDYRRQQNDRYWIDKVDALIAGVQGHFRYPEHRPNYFVAVDMRFENERAHTHECGGNVWHVRSKREGLAPMNDHVSNQQLPVIEPEREIWNNDTVDRLYQGVELMLNEPYQFVIVQPPSPAMRNAMVPTPVADEVVS